MKLWSGFFDDSHIQNLVNAYLETRPKIQYENVPNSQRQSIGLVTVKPKNNTSYLKKEFILFQSIAYLLDGSSNTMPTEEKIKRIFKTRKP
jgi:hypothetical protein